MREFDRILMAWAEREQRGEAAVLATVVDVKGSAYRRPGARMLITEDGQRVGTISGGCLEGDVAKKAWWWTESGRAAVRTYDTMPDDDDGVGAFGLGCNGVIRVLLERLGSTESRHTLAFLTAAARERRTVVIATVIGAAERAEDSAVAIGDRLLLTNAGPARVHMRNSPFSEWLTGESRAALRERKSRLVRYRTAAGWVEAFAEVIAPPVPVLIFGAGDDVIPLVHAAKELGWHVTVADGRPAHAQAHRFPMADQVVLTRPDDLLAGTSIDPYTAVVVMNHNYPADRGVLAEVLARGPAYVGVLGPRARTEKMLSELGLFDPLPTLHAPIGLDIGADTPDGVALSIVAEIQAAMAGRAGGMLRERTGSINENDCEHQTRREAVPA